MPEPPGRRGGPRRRLGLCHALPVAAVAAARPSCGCRCSCCASPAAAAAGRGVRRRVRGLHATAACWPTTSCWSPGCSDGPARQVRITDIWVDSPASRDGGRSLWAIPKELADLPLRTRRLGPGDPDDVQRASPTGQQVARGAFTSLPRAALVRTPFALRTSQERSDGTAVVTAVRRQRSRAALPGVLGLRPRRAAGVPARPAPRAVAAAADVAAVVRLTAAAPAPCNAGLWTLEHAHTRRDPSTTAPKSVARGVRRSRARRTPDFARRRGRFARRTRGSSDHNPALHAPGAAGA